MEIKVKKKKKEANSRQLALVGDTEGQARQGCGAGADGICVWKMEKQQRGNIGVVLHAVSVVCL